MNWDLLGTAVICLFFGAYLLYATFVVPMSSYQEFEQSIDQCDEYLGDSIPVLNNSTGEFEQQTVTQTDVRNCENTTYNEYHKSDLHPLFGDASYPHLKGGLLAGILLFIAGACANQVVRELDE